MQANAILVLHHAHGELEQFEDHARWLGVGQLGMDQHLGAQGVKVDIFGRGGILQARKGGCAGQVGVGIQRLAFQPELEQRIASEGIGVIAVLGAAGDLEDTLGGKRAQRMVGIGGMAPVVESSCKAG